MVFVETSSRWLLAIVFAYSALAKLHSRGSFRRFSGWLADLPVPGARHAGVLAAAVAAAEVSIVVLIALPWATVAGFGLAAATLAIFITGTGLAVARGTTAPCACFGTSGTQLGKHHIARDTGLLAVAVTGAAASAAHGAPPGGLAVSLAAAVVIAVLVIFLDDWLTLFPARRPHPPAALASARGRE
jgi:hypothetical protein